MELGTVENTKNKLSEYWVHTINRLLKKLNLELITPEEFTTVIVQNTDDVLNISVICTGKLLVLCFNQATQKLTGGWKQF